MTFLSERFPECISAGSQGGPGYLTEVTILGSGHERRDIKWSKARHVYNVALGSRTPANAEQLIAFFHVANGRAHSFRYKDWADYKSGSISDNPSDADQLLGYANGLTSTFQLIKKYVIGTNTYTRTINKPVSGTLVLAINGVVQAEGVDYSIDNETGIVTLSGSPTPGSGSPGLPVTAGFEFDVPCRFDTDTLQVNMSTPEILSADVPVVEVRLL